MLPLLTDSLKLAKGRGTDKDTQNRFEKLSYVAESEAVLDREVQRTEVRVENAKKIITRNTSPDLTFDRSINPYRGCEHGCIYCFARPTHAYLDLSPGLDFETKLIARPNAPELLRKELAKPKYTPAPIAIGTNTDAYQPVEQKHKIMRGIIEVLHRHKHPLQITTKGNLIERDIDLLAEMAADNLVSVAITITSLNRVLARRLEPRAPSAKRRIQTVEKLAEAGIPVRVLLSPIIPGLTDHEIENIITSSKNAGAEGGSFALLRLPYEVGPLFWDWLDRHEPGRAEKVKARVRECHGGQDYDPEWGKRMKSEGPHAELIAKRFEVAAKRAGFNQERPVLDCTKFIKPSRDAAQLSLF